ncbi:hypothetical protein ACHBCG_004033 [Escherichia coli]
MERASKMRSSYLYDQ